MADTSKALRAIFLEIRGGMDRGALSAADIASAVGISTAYFESCLSGRKRLAASRLVLACKEAGVDFRSVGQALDNLVGQTTYLRISRAARRYACSYCNSAINRGDSYIRLEPFGPARQSGAPVLHFCRSCSALASWMELFGSSPTIDDRQLLLPLSEHVKQTQVRLIDISSTLSIKILANPNELLRLSPSQFEEFILDRLCAMGLKASLVGGGTFRRDGGIDIIFTPGKNYPFPFLGAVQVKHRKDPDSKVGPEPLRELLGVMGAHRIFTAGMIVTNTTFTVDAKDFARRCQPLLRLRDFHDLMRWVAENFTDDAEWREIPRRIELCDGIAVDLTEL